MNCAIHFPMGYEKADDLQIPNFKMGFGIITAKCTCLPLPFGCPLWENEAVKASYDALTIDLFRPLFLVSRDPLKRLL